MNKIALDKLKQKIEQYFETRINEHVKINKVYKDLRIEKENFILLKDLLEDLTRDGILNQLQKNTFRYAKKLAHDAKGMLSVNKSGVGFVMIEDREEDVVIPRKKMLGAFHGDEVAINILSGQKGKRPEGEIAQVLKRKKVTFVGRFQDDMKFGFVIVDDPKVHADFFIPKKSMNKAENGDKVMVELVSWKMDSRRPEGKITEVLGAEGDADVDMQSIIRSHDITETFPEDVLEQTKRLELDIKPELKYRLDLRDEDIFTIDPIDARDFDDAVSLIVNEKGNYVLGVHIADVSHFVQENTALDKDALARGCSVYLVDRVIPMLPEKISNHLCSLVPNEDRLTYSAIMELDKNSLDIVDYKIKKTIIHSKRRFTYEEAQEVIDTKKGDYSENILMMFDVSQKLRKARFKSGSIEFHSSDIRFQLDETGKPTGVIRKKQLDSMKLIEEFMLLANRCVSEHIEKISAKISKDFPFIYRIHQKPSTEKLAFLQSFLNGLEINVKFPENITPKLFQQIMEPILTGDQAEVINEFAVRSMMKAEYSIENIGHFGLGFDFYSHFTSPIRRYPDLMIHRLLFEFEHGVDSKRRRFLRRNLPSICSQSSDREVIAERAERESIKMKQIEFIADHLGEDFDGKVTGVTDFGIFVEITEFMIEGLIRIDKLSGDHFTFDKTKHTISGKQTGTKFRLGSSVKIRVVDVNKSMQQIDFELAYF